MSRSLPSILLTVAFLLTCSPSLFAQPILESGSLRGFLAGDCPTAEYDNWVSHVSEGVADPGYNDYGPAWLDPQTNGFGSYRLLPPEPISHGTLSTWRRAFDSALLGHADNVAATLDDSAGTFYYETVIFTDTATSHTVLMMREQLDSSFSDGVTGSFRNGWGVFLVDLDAARPWLMIQVVHPCDDFIGLQAGIELFYRLDAGALAIQGAGRELIWDHVGDYRNSKSLSDPSRNPNTPFQQFQDAFVDKFKGDYPHSAFVIQVHSYDRSNELVASCILSEGADWPYPLLPYRDLAGHGNDFVGNMHTVPIQPGLFEDATGDLPSVQIVDYLSLNVDGGYTGITADGEVRSISRSATHRGDPGNVQAIAIHDASVYEGGQAVAPFLHIELDEWPTLFEERGLTFDNYVDHPDGVPTWEDFSLWHTYYEPLYTSLADWFEWFDDPVSDDPLYPPIINSISYEDQGDVRVTFQADVDHYRACIEALADTGLVTPESPVVANGVTDPESRTIINSSTFRVQGLPLDDEVHLAIRCRRLDGSAGPLSMVENVQATDSQLGVPEHHAFSFFPIDAWPPWLAIRFGEEDADLVSAEAVWRLNDGEDQVLELQKMPAYDQVWAAPLPVDTSEVSFGDQFRYHFEYADRSNTGTLYQNGSDPFLFTAIRTGSILKTWDFEEDSNGWSLGGEWEWGTPGSTPPDTAHSGIKVLGTNLAGPYINSSSPSTAVTETVMRPEYGPQVLTWWHSYDYQSLEQTGWARDGGAVNLYLDGQDLTSWPELPGYTHQISLDLSPYYQDCVFSGTQAEWKQVVVDLMPWYGHTASFHFANLVFGETGHMGWYIDDVEVARMVNSAPPLPVTLLAPADGDTLETDTVTFRWEPSTDPDPRTQPSYLLRVWEEGRERLLDAGVDTLVTVDLAALGFFQDANPLLNWQVLAVSQGDTVAGFETRTLVTPVLGVRNDASDLPGAYALSAAWPNPFNASVSLRYDLPRAGVVRLEVFNVLGRRVAVLENGRREAGRHLASWQAQGSASGIYFLRMQAGDFAAVRKLVLMK